MIVWIASYPRSGNTMVRMILNHVFDIKTYSIYNDEFDIGSNNNLSDVVGHIKLHEDFDITEARNSEDLYFIKTHEYPAAENDKTIYVLREGRESTISFWKYLNTYHNKGCKLIDVIYGNNFVGTWGDHIYAWNPKKRENTLIIKYEDMLENRDLVLQDISRFIKKEKTGKNIPEFDELNKANPNFFRSGRRSSWKDIMTDNEHNIFWLKNYVHMLEYGYTNDIPSLFQNNTELLMLVNLLSQEYAYLQKNIIINKDERIEQLNKQIRSIRENSEEKIGELRMELNKILHNRKFRILNFLFRMTGDS